MIGFFGQRHIIDTGGGLLHQRITFHTPEDKKAWEAIFPPGEAPIVSWRNDMTLELGPKRHVIVCQGVAERDQWRKTFRNASESPMRPFARWSSESVLIGSEPATAAAAAGAGENSPEEPLDLASLTPAQLRTRAAELGLMPTRKEPREELEARIRNHLTDHPRE